MNGKDGGMMAGSRRDYQILFEIASKQSSTFKSDMNAAAQALDNIKNKLKQAAEAGTAFNKIESAAKKLGSAKADIDKYAAALEKAKTALNSAKTATQAHIQELNRARSAEKAAADEVKRYSDAQEALDRQFKKGKISLEEYNRLTRSIQTSLQEAEAKERRYAEEVKNCEAQVENARNAERDRNTELKNAEKNLNSATKATQNYEKEIERLNSKLASGPFAGMTQAQVDAYRQNLQTSIQNYEKWSASYDQWKSGVTSSWSSLLRTVNLVALGLGTAYRKLIEPTVEFERQISAVSAAAGGSQRSTEQIRASARDLGRTTVFSAAEVAAGYEVVAKAGWSPEEMLSGMRGLLSLASASGEDLAAVTEIASDTMTAFNVPYDQTQRFADVLSTVAVMTTTDVQQMGDTFKYVAPLAGTLGYEIEDVAAAMGVMANRAIKGSMAGQSIRNILTNLSAPTKSTQEAMDALGVSLTDDDGKAKTFRETIAELRDAFSELSESDKLKYAFDIAGKRGMAGLLALVSAPEETFDEMYDALDHVSGAADRMAEIKLDNLAGDIRLMKDASSDLSLTFGEALTPTMRSATQGMTEFINGLNEKISSDPDTVVGATKLLVGSLAGLVGVKALTFGGNVLGAAGSGVMKLASGAKLLADSVVSNGNAKFLTRLSAGAKTAAESVDGLGAKLGLTALSAAAAHPVLTALGVTLAGVAGGAVALYEHNEKLIQQNMAEHFGSVSLSLADINEIIDDLFYDEKVERFSAAMESVSAAQKSMQETIESYDKQTYLSMKMGLELDSDQSNTYAKTVEAYVSGLKTYLKENAYQLDLIYDDLGLKLDPGDNVYLEAYDQAAQIGQEIADSLNEALEDGIVTPIEEAAIDAKVQELTEIYERFENAKKGAAYNADNAGYVAEYRSSQMDLQSFETLQGELDTRAQERYQELYGQYIVKSNELYAAVDIAKQRYEASGSSEDKTRWESAIGAYATHKEQERNGTLAKTLVSPFVQSVALQTSELEKAYPKIAQIVNDNHEKIQGAIAKWQSEGYVEKEVKSRTRDLLVALGADKTELNGFQQMLDTTASSLSNARQIAENYGMSEEEFDELFGGYSAMVDLVGNLPASVLDYIKGYGASMPEAILGDLDAREIAQAGDEIETVTENANDLRDAIETISGQPLIDVMQKIMELGPELDEQSENADGLRDAIGTISGQPLIDVMQKIMELGPEIVEQSGNMTNFGDTTAAAGQKGQAAIDGVGQSLNALPSKKTITINVETSSAYAAIDGIASKLNSLKGAISTIISGDAIEGNAEGTDYAADAFIAGERGPELIVGARGRTVFTNAQTDAMLRAQRDVTESARFVPALMSAALSGGGSGGAPTIHIYNNQTISGGSAAEIAAAQISVNDDLVRQILRALEEKAHDRARVSRF